jgi:hypothetical protein
MMRVVQNKLHLIEYHPKPGAMARLYLGTQVMEQGFNFAPMNIGANRFLKDSLEYAQVVTHTRIIRRPKSSSIILIATIIDRLFQRHDFNPVNGIERYLALLS